MSSITTAELILAAGATNEPDTDAASGLRPLTDLGGNILSITTTTGVTANAVIDAAGNVIINYGGTTDQAQQNEDQQIALGTNPNQIQGFQDAVGFAKSVLSVAEARGIPTNQVFVTGFSLGGTQAQYVSQQTGLAGASFAGAGLPGFHNTKPAANFTSYVAYGDYWGQLGSDTAEAPGFGATQDHFGALAQIGAVANASILTRIWSEAFVDSLPWASAAQRAQLTSDVNAAYAIHNLDVYASDIAAAGLGASLTHGTSPIVTVAPATS